MTERAITNTERALLARMAEDRDEHTAPTEAMLATRIRAAHDARLAHSPNAYEDALLDVASAAALIYEHRQKLRSAA